MSSGQRPSGKSSEPLTSILILMVMRPKVDYGRVYASDSAYVLKAYFLCTAVCCGRLGY
jgi:hypothetical protein